LLLALLLIFSSTSLYAETLNIAVHEFCPYLCDAAKEEGKEGFVVEIIRAIFEPAYTLRFHRVPYVRGIRLTEQGEYHGMPMLNSQSSQEIHLSKELIAILVQNFYVKKGDPWRYEGVASLENIIVGTVIGYNYSPVDREYEAYLRKHRYTDKVDYTGGVGASLANLKKILAGRIRTFNECSYLVDYLGMTAGITGQLEVAGTLGVLDNFMGFSPKHPNAQVLVGRFDEGIRKLRESGQLNRILDRYGLEDWQKR
jgi:polar amino acid transport system substrate-binding protein